MRRIPLQLVLPVLLVDFKIGMDFRVVKLKLVDHRYSSLFKIEIRAFDHKRLIRKLSP